MKKSSSLPLIITLLVVAGIIAGAILTKSYWKPVPPEKVVVTTTKPAEVVKVPVGVEVEVKEPVKEPAKEEVGIMAQSELVLAALKNKNDEVLATYVHPDLGVRFTTSSYIDVMSNQNFTAAQISTALSDPKKYTWGYQDGSGEPIDLTFMEYWNRWIYDKDFANAPQVSAEKILGTSGNTLNNQKEIYPNATIVEYHFPGFDPQYGGMDWESLRLVFQQKDDTWYLVGIIHDQWSI